MVPDERAGPVRENRRRTGAKPLLVNGFLSMALLCIGACATLPSTHRELDFSVAGRVGAVAGKTGTSAEFIWRQYDSGFDVEFWGPLGQGRTRLAVDGGAFSVVTARGARISGQDARDWIRRELQLEVPIRALSSWITGRPAREWPVREIDIDAFRQLGWDVRVAAWGDWEGRRQPRKLTASQGDYRITIVCRQWTFDVP